MHLISKLGVALVLSVINAIVHAGPPNANIIIVKTVINDNGGNAPVSNFGIVTTAGIPFFTTPSTGTLPNYIYTSDTLSVPSKTDITISEQDLPGYTEGSWNCAGTTGPASGVSVNLNPNSTVICTITNNDIAPTLALVKNLDNTGGGTNTIADFDISINATEVTSGAATLVTANTNITISELDLTNYAEGSWSCNDANSITSGLPNAGAATGTTVNLQPGSEVTCIISNNYISPIQQVDLSIIKSVNDTNPSIGQMITFTMLVSNAGPDTATSVTVNDILPAGFSYVTASIMGGNSRSDSSPAGTGLTWTIDSLTVAPTAGSNTVLTFQAIVLAP